MNKNEFMKHIRKEFIDLIKEQKEITIQNEPKRMNSYEMNYLSQFWSNELLLKRIKDYINLCYHKYRKTPYNFLESTYEDNINHKLIHMLIERFERLINEN